MKAFALALAAVGLLAVGGVARADVVTTTKVAFADTSINMPDPNTNYGSINYLSAQYNWWPYSMGYLNFDLSTGLPAGQVTSAHLLLDLYPGSSGTSATDVFAVMDPTKDWWAAGQPSETTLTWNNATLRDPANDGFFLNEGPDVASSIVRHQGPGQPCNAGIDVDVTGLVQWMLGQTTTFASDYSARPQITFVFRKEGYDHYSATTYYSKEGGNATAPRLVITQTAVPEPMTMAFLAAGGIGLVGAAIRRRRAA